MKIAFLTTTFDPERKEAKNITLKDLTTWLVNRGHLVTIVCRKAKGQKSYHKFNGVNIVRLKSFKFSRKYFLDPLVLYNEILLYKRGVKKAKQLLDINHFDVIVNVCSSPLIGLRTLQLKISEKKTKFITLIKALSAYTKYSFSPGSFYFSSFLKHNDKIIVPLKSIRTSLIKRGIDPKKISLVNSYINLQKFKSNDKSKLRNRHRIKNKRILLYYGLFNEHKGIEYLIKSLKYLRLKDCLLYLIPNLDNRKHMYDEVIDKERAWDKIKILESSTNIVDFINIADAVVLPYPHLKSTEANPSCLLESLACKTPVVTSDIPELKEIVKDKIHVLMARPRDSRSIARNIKLIYKEKSLVQKMVKNGFNLAKQFDSMKIMPKHLEIYEEVMNQPN